MKGKILFDKIPASWTYCFNDSCERKSDCLRYIAGDVLLQQVPDKHLWESCVTPLAWRNGPCRMFRAIKVQRVAWGFDALFATVLHKDYLELKARITEHLRGRSNFYRYRSGELVLSESQQQWISDLFESFGYTLPIAFDHYDDRVMF